LVRGCAVYGTVGVASTTNLPGARSSAVSWTDSSGNLWLFGGDGYDSTGTWDYLNDLWEYVPSTRTWTWVGGSSQVDASATYGVEYKASTSNAPGARIGSVSWTDLEGNLWLFGGQGRGFPAPGLGQGGLNDLLEYIPSTVAGAAGTWTWVGGSSALNAPGVYGTQGAASTTNSPGARLQATSWSDSAGNLWLFGGALNRGIENEFNDLWEYIPSTVAGGAGTWTWLSGSNVANANGVYAKTATPILMPFFPAYATSVGSFQQIVLTGTYPSETIWIPDGNVLWVALPNGTEVAYSPVRGTGQATGGIVLGPDGAVWFPVQPTTKAVTANTSFKIARVDISGSETDYLFSASAQPSGIAIGPDNNLWITANTGPGVPSFIGQMLASGNNVGTVTPYTVQTSNNLKGVYGPITLTLGPAIISAPNSALWFTETQSQASQPGGADIRNAYYLGEIAITGQVSSFALPVNFTPINMPFDSEYPGSNAGIAVDSGGNLWIAGMENANTSTATYGLLEVPPPTSSASPNFLSAFYQLPNNAYVVTSVVTGRDGALWGTLLPSTVLLSSSVPPAPPALLRMTTNGVVSYVPISLPAQPTYTYQPAGSCTLQWDSTGVLWFDVCGVVSGPGSTYKNIEAFIGRFEPQ
jgi:hypothetical protein